MYIIHCVTIATYVYLQLAQYCIITNHHYSINPKSTQNNYTCIANNAYKIIGCLNSYVIAWNSRIDTLTIVVMPYT